MMARPNLVPEQAPEPGRTALHRVIGRVAPTRRRWVVAALGLIALHLGNPLVWGHPLPDWWFPPVGVGLVLVAWLGPRAVLLVFVEVLVAGLQGRLRGTPTLWGEGWPALGGAVVEGVVLSAEVLAAWFCYHTLGRGSRRLGDPRSATLFLILVPTFTAGGFASLLGLAGWLMWHGDPEPVPLTRWVSIYWLSHALGMLAVAPPLLATLTPWLVRHRFARGETPVQAADVEEPRRMSWGDIAEITAMALLLAFLSLLQAFINSRPEVAGWQLWGLPLLVIVWASLRHGLRGGTIMASSSVGAPLILLGLLLPPTISYPFHELSGSLNPIHPILQANLLAECSTALLAAAAANYIRLSEVRYRQVVTRIPVVLYSAG